MSAESFDDIRFPCVLLSAEVSVEDGVLAAEHVGGLLVVVILEVADETGTHVCVVWARADGGVNHGSSQFVKPSGGEPDGHDDQSEVDGNQGATFFRIFNLDRVEMHVVLGGLVGVQDSVDVLQVVSSGVLVVGVGLGVRTVEASSSGKHGGCSLLEYRSASAHKHRHLS